MNRAQIKKLTDAQLDELERNAALCRQYNPNGLGKLFRPTDLSDRDRAEAETCF